jgi:hypothetical protein
MVSEGKGSGVLLKHLSTDALQMLFVIPAVAAPPPTDVRRIAIMNFEK